MNDQISAEFISVCRAVTADGQITGDELWFIANWLNEHRDALKVWPGSLFVEPLNRFFADGVIEVPELEEAAQLIAQVEREWQQQSTSDPAEPAEEALSLPGLTFDWYHLALPSVKWRGHVESSDGDGHYTVDLREPSCNCPDWDDYRRQYPPLHPNRACKHVVHLLREHIQETPDACSKVLIPLIESAYRRKAGISPFDRYAFFQLNADIILLSIGRSAWVNVLAPKARAYERFGYSLDEDRWSYGVRPRGHGHIERVIRVAAQTL